MFEECGKKQPVKIKQHFASNGTVLGKHMGTGFGTILGSTPTGHQGRFSLPISSSMC